MTLTEIEAKAKEIKEWQRLAEEAAETITALQDEIKAAMLTANIDTVLAGAFKVTWKPVESSRLDASALKRELPDVAARYTKTATTRRFTIV